MSAQHILSADEKWLKGYALITVYAGPLNSYEFYDFESRCGRELSRPIHLTLDLTVVHNLVLGPWTLAFLFRELHLDWKLPYE